MRRQNYHTVKGRVGQMRRVHEMMRHKCAILRRGRSRSFWREEILI